MLGILQGILLAAVASVLMLLVRASRPHVAFLGRIPGTSSYSDVARHPENEALPGVTVARPEASLTCVNADAVLASILNRVRAASSPHIPTVVCDLSASPYLDLAGAHMLHDLRSAGRCQVTGDWIRKLRLGVLLPSVIALAACEGMGIHDTESLIHPTLSRSDVIGLVAGFGTTVAALPDLLVMLKRRSSAGMNPRMAGIMCVFQFAWVYYGLLILSRPVIIWNVIAIMINGLSVGAYLHFMRKERSQAKGR